MVDLERVCPFCEGKMKSGFLWKHHGGQLMLNDGGFKWFDGEIRKSNYLDSNIPIGEWVLCRRVFLESFVRIAAR